MSLDNSPCAFHPSRMRLRLIEQMQQKRRYDIIARQRGDSIPNWPIHLIHPSQRASFVQRLRQFHHTDNDNDNDDPVHSMAASFGLGFFLACRKNRSSLVRFGLGRQAGVQEECSVTRERSGSVSAGDSWERPWTAALMDKNYGEILHWIRSGKMSPNEPIVTIVQIVPEPDGEEWHLREVEGEVEVEVEGKEGGEGEGDLQLELNEDHQLDHDDSIHDSIIQSSSFVHVTYPIHVAVHNHDQQLFKFLLMHPESNLNQVSGCWGWTPLHRAAYWGWSDFVRELVNSTHCDLQARDILGRTAVEITKFDTCLEWLLQ